MRWLVALIIILLAIWYFSPEPHPTPVEESFIAEPVTALRKAEGYEDEYLKATVDRK